MVLCAAVSVVATAVAPMPAHADASPSPIVDMIEAVRWRLHNRRLQALSDQGLGNHCCDELMALRRGFGTGFGFGILRGRS